MDGQLSAISNIVVLMLENRSFDHMLGFLYADSGNVTPTGQAFDGLKGTESNSDGKGGTVKVYKVDPSGTYAYFTPGADTYANLSALPGIGRTWKLTLKRLF